MESILEPCKESFHNVSCLVAIAVAERHGHRILFRGFLVKGLPFMVATVGVTTLFFYVRLILNF